MVSSLILYHEASRVGLCLPCSAVGFDCTPNAPTFHLGTFRSLNACQTLAAYVLNATSLAQHPLLVNFSTFPVSITSELVSSGDMSASVLLSPAVVQDSYLQRPLFPQTFKSPRGANFNWVIRNIVPGLV